MKPILIKEVDPYISPAGHKLRKGLFKCICGREWEAGISEIKRGHTRSCGCLPNKGNTKHGMKRHPLYTYWKGIRQRCNNPNAESYPNYGGRGIAICSEWNDFAIFHKWAMRMGWKPGLAIDRIDNNGNYEPSNCHWITNGENSRHKRTTKMTWENVRKMRSIKKNNPKLYDREIAAMFGISQQNCNKILNNKLWVDDGISLKKED